MTNEEMIEFARKVYPVGTIFIPAHIDPERAEDINNYAQEVTDAIYHWQCHETELKVVAKPVLYDWVPLLYYRSSRKWAPIYKGGKVIKVDEKYPVVEEMYPIFN